MIDKDKRLILRGSFYFDKVGIAGGGLKASEGSYMHLFGRLRETEELDKDQKKITKFYMDTTEEKISEFFNGLSFLDPKDLQKL